MDFVFDVPEEDVVVAAWACSTSTPPPVTLAVPITIAAFWAFCRNPLRLVDDDGPADQALTLEKSIPKKSVAFAVVDDFMIIVDK